MAYSFVRPIFVSPQQIGSVQNPSALSNFTVLLVATLSDLATVANGGSVTSSSGYDIVVASDSAGLTLASFQMQSYDAATGTVRIAIKLSSMVATSGTLLYLLYANSAITTDQGVGAASVWDANTADMWHLEDLTDSGPSGLTLTATGSPTSGATGLIGNGYTFTNASTQYLAASSAAVSGYPCTISARAKLSTTSLSSGIDRVIAAVCQTGGLNEFWLSYYNNSGATVVRAVAQSGSNVRGAQYQVTLDTNWHHIAGVFTSASSIAIYFDGVNVTASFNLGGSGTPTPTSLDTTYIGNFLYNTSNFYQGFLGTVDEVKIASVARTPDWIATENSDQGGYVTVGPLLTTGGGSGNANYGFMG